VFIGGISPEGSGYEIEDIRVEENDLRRIPQNLTAICCDGLQSLGQPENILLDELSYSKNAPNIRPPVPSVLITADYDVYPNIAEPTEWWRLGNLKTDGVDKILRAYRNETPPGMTANRTIPIYELARRYGDINSKKLYTKGDLICRFMHLWGVDYVKKQK
jgi:hypothetical protein